jgi:hypothetical protein
MVNAMLGWTIYSLLLKDYYLFIASSFPLITGVILCLTCINLLDVTNRPAEEVMRLRVELILVVSMTLWIVISFITLLAFPTSLSNEGLIIIGSFADTSSFIYYCAPLSFAVEVIMTKNSKRFYIPTILLNLLTTILWFLYGLVGVNEITVWLPNIIGTFIGSHLCMLLGHSYVYFIYINV